MLKVYLLQSQYQFGSTKEKQKNLFSDMNELKENIAAAREYALLNNYDSSVIYYQGAITSIPKLTRNPNVSPDERSQLFQIKVTTYYV